MSRWWASVVNTMLGACLANSAIFCNFVEMGSEPDVSVILPHKSCHNLAGIWRAQHFHRRQFEPLILRREDRELGSACRSPEVENCRRTCGRRKFSAEDCGRIAGRSRSTQLSGAGRLVARTPSAPRLYSTWRFDKLPPFSGSLFMIIAVSGATARCRGSSP